MVIQVTGINIEHVTSSGNKKFINISRMGEDFSITNAYGSVDIPLEVIDELRQALNIIKEET